MYVGRIFKVELMSAYFLGESVYARTTSLVKFKTLDTSKKTDKGFTKDIEKSNTIC